MESGEKGAENSAAGLFMRGYNCSQAVFAAFSKEVGLPRQMALQLASGFGGGIGRMR